MTVKKGRCCSMALTSLITCHQSASMMKNHPPLCRSSASDHGGRGRLRRDSATALCPSSSWSSSWADSLVPQEQAERARYPMSTVVVVETNASSMYDVIQNQLQDVAHVAVLVGGRVCEVLLNLRVVRFKAIFVIVIIVVAVLPCKEVW